MDATSLYKTITKLHTLPPTNETLIRRLYKIQRLICQFTVRENTIMLHLQICIRETFIFLPYTKEKIPGLEISSVDLYSYNQ